MVEKCVGLVLLHGYRPGASGAPGAATENMERQLAAGGACVVDPGMLAKSAATLLTCRVH